MAQLLVLGLVVLVIFGPITVALIALSSVGRLRRRLEEVERFSEMRAARLTERLKHLEEGRPVAPPVPPPPPPQAPEPVRVRPDMPAPPFPEPPPRILLPPKPPPPAPKESVPLENMIGERILPRIGVVALVLGLGLLVYYAYGQFGPRGRIALAGGTGALMVAGGAFLRRNVNTQLLGGCLIGGGWAVVYIAAYAAHFVPRSQIIESRLLGFLILFGVSEAALIHALRYRNETITGLAYLLTIVSLLLSPEPGPPAWLAMGLSAVVLVALAWREKWIRLCTFGATLLYVAEAVWLSKTPPAGILPALAVLVALWMLWILPDYFHRPATDGARRAHGLLIAVNFGGLLVIAGLIQHWFDLVNMGWVWLTLGGLYGVNAFAGRKAAWRPAYLSYLGFGAMLAGVGTHFLLPGIGAPFAWMAIAAALAAWGFWTKDEAPRLLAVAAAAVAFLRFWFSDRREDFAFAPATVLAAGLYALSAALGHLRRAKTGGETEAGFIRPLSHLAALALGLAIATYPPHLTEAMTFAAAGLVLILLGPRLGVSWLVAEGTCFLAVAVFFVAASTLPSVGDVLGVSRRVATTVPVLLAWLIAARVYPRSDPLAERVRVLFGVWMFAGVLALLGFERGPSEAPVAWSLACGAWFAWSRLARRDFEFVLAALGAAATVLAYTVSPALRVPGFRWDGPVASGAVIMAVFVAIHVASRRLTTGGIYSVARDAVAAAMALTGFVLLARQMSGTWLTGSWAVLGFALAGYGFLFRDRVSRWSSLLVLGVCLGKVAIFDLATFEMPVKIATLLTLGAVMVALSFVYARHHRRIVGYLAGKE